MRVFIDHPALASNMTLAAPWRTLAITAGIYGTVLVLMMVVIFLIPTLLLGIA